MRDFPLLVPASFDGALNVRYDEAAGAVPLSVADMDFQAPSQVVQAVTERAAHGAYGYTYAPQSLAQATADWFRARHSLDLDPHSIIHTGRVVEAVPTLLNTLTNPGDPVVVPSPSYAPITNAVTANNRALVTVAMARAGHDYSFDLAAIRQGLSHPTTSRPVLILTNPHNPTGRVFTAQELVEVAQVAEECGALIISDDVHADILYPGQKYTPIWTVSKYAKDNSITFTSPGKTFNLAGLESTDVLVNNEELRGKVSGAFSAAGFHNPAYFAVAATQAAYEWGAPWLDQFLALMNLNLNTLLSFIDERQPKIRVTKPEGTYLVWLDLTALGDAEEVSAALKSAGLVLSCGSGFGADCQQFARMNIATTPKILEEALDRLDLACKTLHVNTSNK